MNRIKQQWQRIPVRWKDEVWAPEIEHRPGSRGAVRAEPMMLRIGARRPKTASTYIVRCGNLYLRSEIRSTWR